MRRWTALAILLMSTTLAHAGKYDYFECVDGDGGVSYSVTKCPKGEKQKIIRSDEAPGESVTTYVPTPALAKPGAAPGQAGGKEAPPPPPGSPAPVSPNQ